LLRGRRYLMTVRGRQGFVEAYRAFKIRVGRKSTTPGCSRSEKKCGSFCVKVDGDRSVGTRSRLAWISVKVRVKNVPHKFILGLSSAWGCSAFLHVFSPVDVFRDAYKPFRYSVVSLYFPCLSSAVPAISRLHGILSRTPTCVVLAQILMELMNMSKRRPRTTLPWPQTQRSRRPTTVPTVDGSTC